MTRQGSEQLSIETVVRTRAFGRQWLSKTLLRLGRVARDVERGETVSRAAPSAIFKGGFETIVGARSLGKRWLRRAITGAKERRVSRARDVWRSIGLNVGVRSTFLDIRAEQQPASGIFGHRRSRSLGSPVLTLCDFSGSEQDRAELRGAPREPAPDVQAPTDARTTIVLRQLPSFCATRRDLLELLDARGFGARYDFVYMPIDFKQWRVFGYAFVNMTSHADAIAAFESFSCCYAVTAQARPICEVVWCAPLQGLEAHVERYRNSPVLCDPSITEEHKPLLLDGGVPVMFPQPSKKPKALRVRRSVTSLVRGQAKAAEAARAADAAA